MPIIEPYVDELSTCDSQNKILAVVSKVNSAASICTRDKMYQYIGTDGLSGCCSLILMSANCIYLSHIYSSVADYKSHLDYIVQSSLRAFNDAGNTNFVWGDFNISNKIYLVTASQRDGLFVRLLKLCIEESPALDILCVFAPRILVDTQTRQLYTTASSFFTAGFQSYPTHSSPDDHVATKYATDLVSTDLNASCILTSELPLKYLRNTLQIYNDLKQQYRSGTTLPWRGRHATMSIGDLERSQRSWSDLNGPGATTMDKRS